MRTLIFLLTLLLVVGCGGDTPVTQETGQGPGAAQTKQNNLPAAPVAVTMVESGPIASYYRATASLEAEKQAEVLARAEGVVAVLQAEEGDMVQAGDALLRIENDQYRYYLEQAEARTQQLRSAYDRLEEMRREELASEQEYETARADLASAEADEGLARLNLSYLKVTAPFAGVVTERLVDPGQTVNMNTPLFKLVSMTPLLARVHVPSREFRQLELDQAVELVLDSSRKQLTGLITLISPVIDPASGTIKVTVEVADYPAGTRPGDFAEVRIVTEHRPQAILVPRTAVVTEKGESVLYVVAGEDAVHAERRVVTVGFTDNDHAQIMEGVVPGDRVVIKGQRSLKNNQPLKILEGPA